MLGGGAAGEVFRDTMGEDPESTSISARRVLFRLVKSTLRIP